MRQFDIEILQTIQAVSQEPTLLSLSSTQHTHRAVTGMQKAVQRYITTLTTALGSVSFDARFGTNFWRDMQRGAAQNPGRLAAALSFANFDALRSMRLDDEDTETYGVSSPDERLVSVKLVDFVVDSASGTLYLKLDLINAAGAHYAYELPVEFMGG